MIGRCLTGPYLKPSESAKEPLGILVGPFLFDAIFQRERYELVNHFFEWLAH
jgi:hypothetical protein